MKKVVHFRFYQDRAIPSIHGTWTWLVSLGFHGILVVGLKGWTPSLDSGAIRSEAAGEYSLESVRVAIDYQRIKPRHQIETDPPSRRRLKVRRPDPKVLRSDSVNAIIKFRNLAKKTKVRVKAGGQDSNKIRSNTSESQPTLAIPSNLDSGNKANSALYVANSKVRGQRGKQIFDAFSEGWILGDNVKPVYPRWSAQMGEEGLVLVRVWVAAGQVKKCIIEGSSGYEALDSSALSAIEKWKFQASFTKEYVQKVRFQLVEGL